MTNRYGQNGKCVSLLEVLSFLRPRVALYTGEPTLSSIAAYLSGYEMACAACDAHMDYAELDLAKFTDWLEHKKGLMKSGRGWRQIIVDSVGEDGPEAVKEFFFLLDEYRDRK